MDSLNGFKNFYSSNCRWVGNFKNGHYDGNWIVTKFDKITNMNFIDTTTGRGITDNTEFFYDTNIKPLEENNYQLVNTDIEREFNIRIINTYHMYNAKLFHDANRLTLKYSKDVTKTLIIESDKNKLSIICILPMYNIIFVFLDQHLSNIYIDDRVDVIRCLARFTNNKMKILLNHTPSTNNFKFNMSQILRCECEDLNIENRRTRTGYKFVAEGICKIKFIENESYTFTDLYNTKIELSSNLTISLIQKHIKRATFHFDFNFRCIEHKIYSLSHDIISHGKYENGNLIKLTRLIDNCRTKVKYLYNRSDYYRSPVCTLICYPNSDEIYAISK